MIFDNDKYLLPYRRAITERYMHLMTRRDEIAGCGGKLDDSVNNHLYYGMHREHDGTWVFREWAPNATRIYLIGDFNGWQLSPEFSLKKLDGGNWEIRIPSEKIGHGMFYKLYLEWNGGGGERIPSYATRCVQDEHTKLFCAQIWNPEKPYEFKYGFSHRVENPLIYEAHIGMAGEECGVSTFLYFKDNVLPRIKKLGYNVLQIMALQEHPYYGSFGYQVSGFFALSSRFGTPEDFKELVDAAHAMDIAVIMDIVHSHAVKNETEGLSRFDGTYDLYFHGGPKGEHPAWGTRCFDYGKDTTVMFLLSNCKFWLEEYNIDGFRFDGITSMIYWDHGLGRNFTSYADYFDGNEDGDALTYLGLANMLVKEIKPLSLTIAEDMSGMPGLAASVEEGGFGFDFRMSMGVADSWIKWIKELPDERWNMGEMYYNLTDKRADEHTISYAECHDQALVGDKTIIFRLMDKEMYTSMSLDSENMIVDRGMALHKMIRLATIATAGNGYLNFMGNEFGHPEWIDFPREGNGWSYKYARRQWSLSDNGLLRYGCLRSFDSAMIHLFKSGRILSEPPISVYNDNQKQVMIIWRKGFLFVFNFSPSNSYFSYRIPMNGREGKYAVALDSDWKEFDGFERNDRNMFHFTEKSEDESFMKVYLPARTAFVMNKK